MSIADWSAKWASEMTVPLAQASSSMDWENFARHVLASVIYSVIGLFFFCLIFWLGAKVTPFSIRKEIEEDQNTALGIIIGAVIIGIALIISAAVHG